MGQVGQRTGFVNLSYNGFIPRTVLEAQRFRRQPRWALIGGLVLGSLLNQATATDPRLVVYRVRQCVPSSSLSPSHGHFE